MKRVEKVDFDEFGWDPAKQELNVQNHGIGFDEALMALSRGGLTDRANLANWRFAKPTTGSLP